MNEIILDDHEGWDIPMYPPYHRKEHYFIRIKGSMYGLSLCGKYEDWSFQWMNPNKTGEELNKMFPDEIKVCEKCNELLKKRMKSTKMDRFLK